MPKSRIWVKSGPGNNAKIEISQIWVKYGPETAKAKQITVCRQCLCFGNMFGIAFETNLSKHGRRMLADPENIIFMFQILRKWIDHALNPWPPVEPLTAV